MKRITIYLPETLREKLRKIAFKLRRSVASIIREAVELWFTKNT